MKVTRDYLRKIIAESIEEAGAKGYTKIPDPDGSLARTRKMSNQIAAARGPNFFDDEEDGVAGAEVYVAKDSNNFIIGVYEDKKTAMQAAKKYGAQLFALPMNKNVGPGGAGRIALK